MGLATSNNLIKKKPPSQVYKAAWILVNYRCSKVHSQEYHHSNKENIQRCSNITSSQIYLHKTQITKI